jgi:hypothetical protein
MFFFEFLNISQSSQLLNFFAVFLDVTWLVAVDAKLSDSAVGELFDPSWAKIVEFLVQLSSLQTNFQFPLHLSTLICSLRR